MFLLAGTDQCMKFDRNDPSVPENRDSDYWMAIFTDRVRRSDIYFDFRIRRTRRENGMSQVTPSILWSW